MILDSGNNSCGDDESLVETKKIIVDAKEIRSDMNMEKLEDQTAIKGWLEWCRSHSSVRCVEYEVPQNILPKGYNGVLIDVKVGGAKRAPDDKIYLAHKELRAKVARGNCVLELHKIEKGRISSTKYIFLVFALKKFSGGLGDEDDSNFAQSQWHHYFIKGIESTKRVVVTEKVNGEAAHISSRKLFGQTYFCIGSKNVHMLIRNSDDIAKYKESRFEFARSISQTFFRNYLDNPEIDDLKKQNFLTHVQNNHLTLVAEIIQPNHQHVVNLSYLKEPELKFICWTKPDFLSKDFNENSTTLCPLPIDTAIVQALEFGLTTVDYEIIEIVENATTEIEEYMSKIRKEHGHEGKVLYFLDENNSTIGLIKKKTAWYVILRAVREKVATFNSSQSSSSMVDRAKNIKKRIDQIKLWLGLSNECAKNWTELSTEFARWLHLNSNQAINIRANFPVIFHQFLLQNSQQRKIYEELTDTKYNINTT